MMRLNYIFIGMLVLSLLAALYDQSGHSVATFALVSLLYVAQGFLGHLSTRKDAGVEAQFAEMKSRIDRLSMDIGVNR